MREAFEKAVKRMGAPGGEVGAKAVTADIFEFMFVGQGRNGALGVIFGKRFVEEDEVSEAAAYAEGGSLEGFEVRLNNRGLAGGCCRQSPRTVGGINVRVW